MFLVGTLDWTLLINTTIITVGTIANGLGVAWVIRQVKTPSGDTLGAVAERTHDLATVSAMTLHRIDGGGEAADHDNDRVTE